MSAQQRTGQRRNARWRHITNCGRSCGLAILLDFAFGDVVTGGRWPLNAANVLLICFQGLAVGCTAGWIAKTKGMLVAALANYLPLFLIVAVSIAVNRDLFAYSDTHFDTKPALWFWISLVPAMIAGHFAAKIVQQGGSAAIVQVLAVIFLFGVGIGSMAMHLYTTYVAYGLPGKLLISPFPQS
jgi:hypothetical protein